MDGNKNDQYDNIAKNDEQDSTCSIDSKVGKPREEGCERSGLKSKKHERRNEKIKCYIKLE